VIFDRYGALSRYAALGANFETAIRFLSGRTPDSFSPGKMAIDGENVYASVREADLTGRQMRWEAHRRYADIQVLLDGGEDIYCAPEGELEPSVPYDGGRDVEFYQSAPGVRFRLKPGDFLIFFPGEPHAPDCPGEGAGFSRKLVVKVLV
jgi:YhcH/YjgK/YiaL family protein